jgi:hypothetical protein
MSKLAAGAFLAVFASLMAVVVTKDAVSGQSRPADAAASAPGTYRQTSHASYACDFAGRGIRLHVRADAATLAVGAGYPRDGFSVNHWYGSGTMWAYGTDITTGRIGWVYGAYLTPGCRRPR